MNKSYRRYIRYDIIATCLESGGMRIFLRCGKDKSAKKPASGGSGAASVTGSAGRIF